jgi:hypothetical protein
VIVRGRDRMRSDRLMGNRYRSKFPDRSAEGLGEFTGLLFAVLA